MSTHPDCIFCKIAANSIPVKRLDEDEMSLAFADMDPQAPEHLLLIPKTHYANVAEAPAEVLGPLLAKAGRIGARELPGGFRIVINTGDDGGQTVHHLHLHILGGRHMTWPPG
jgi:histidine triad (HIT) family protein